MIQLIRPEKDWTYIRLLEYIFPYEAMELSVAVKEINTIKGNKYLDLQNCHFWRNIFEALPLINGLVVVNLICTIVSVQKLKDNINNIKRCETLNQIDILFDIENPNNNLNDINELSKWLPNVRINHRGYFQ
ncbi:MAG: hypothetical protein QM528_02865 [Phycisphaerales bacterium]|nr:hypothetical protein [Phycisphaerales bacterium]